MTTQLTGELSPEQKKQLQDLGIEVADKMMAIMGSEAPASDAEKDPELHIIDSSALPVEYFLRESVMTAVHAEILKDYKQHGNLPAGVSLKNQVETRNGEAKETPESDSSNVQQPAAPDNGSGGEVDESTAGGGSADSEHTRS